jgi:hypothetical protein
LPVAGLDGCDRRPYGESQSGLKSGHSGRTQVTLLRAFSIRRAFD